MSSDNHILNASKELVEALNKVVDKNLPAEIADVVKTHAAGAATASVAAGWVPGAGGVAAAAICAGFVWTMYGRINSKIGLSLADNLLKTLATGVATNLATGFVGTLLVTTLLGLIPGLGTLGAVALAGATGYALTIAAGFVYLKLLTKFFLNGQDPTRMDADTLGAVARDVAANENLSDVISGAKAAYKASSK